MRAVRDLRQQIFSTCLHIRQRHADAQSAAVVLFLFIYLLLLPIERRSFNGAIFCAAPLP
jgi:membrane-anchored glycerophosphoryl diester phosphodiesterase (GDPDase)